MSAFNRLLFRIARMIAGRERREWIDAMQTEAAIDGSGGHEWGMGSVLAALKDRASRDGFLMVAIVLTPIAALVFSLLLFFPMSRLFMADLLPSWIYSLTMLLVGLPFGWFLGRLRPKAAMAAVSVSFAIFVAIPMMVFWAGTGRSPLIFFAPDANWYGMPTYIGLTAGLLVWLVGARLGSRTGRVLA